MHNFITNLVAVVVVLGIMILIHEWGHFVAAKLFGVRVNVFSLGFGPRLFGFQRGPTDYRLSALPFGGYVKMAGDNPTEERSGAPDEFLSKPRWQRVLIAIAGPTMNVLLAVALMMGLYMVGAPEPPYMNQPAVVAGVLPGSDAEKAGLRTGDRIVQINSVKNPLWADALFELAVTPPGGKISLDLDRGGQRISVVEPAAALQDVHHPRDEGDLLGYPEAPVIIGAITPGFPAEKAGLKPDDQVISANGQPLHSPVEFAAIIRQSEGKPVSLVVKRRGAELPITVYPMYGDPSDGVKRWAIGVAFGTTNVYKSHSLPDAARRSVWFNVKLARQIGSVLAGLFEGRVSLKQLEGPVGISREAGQAARRGPMDFISLMAVISLNLGILNLLPIPILDGGHILLLAIEGTLRRDLSVSVKERFVQVGLVFLLAVFAFVMYYDVLKLLPNH
jgi:regulator of sigma E protease